MLFCRAFIATVSLALLTMGGCKSTKSDYLVDEGRIEYKITYLDDEATNPVIILLPEKMQMLFKENNTLTKIRGYYGLFSFSFISNAQNNQNLTLLKILDKKYCYGIENGSPAFGYNPMPNLKIEYLEQCDTVLGFPCKMARVYFDGQEHGPYIFSYTDAIGIEAPNRNNPFNAIPGVLLKFQVKLNNINMKFQAETIEQIAVESDEFEKPSAYDVVSYDTMKELFDSYMSEGKSSGGQVLN